MIIFKQQELLHSNVKQVFKVVAGFAKKTHNPKVTGPIPTKQKKPKLTLRFLFLKVSNWMERKSVIAQTGLLIKI